MILQPTSSFCEALVREFILQEKGLRKLHETLTMVYVQWMGNPLLAVSEDVEREDMERDAFMSCYLWSFS